MSTFLGQVKYEVIWLLTAIPILGACLAVGWVFLYTWVRKDIVFFAIVLGALIGMGILVLFVPGRPVTPFELLLH